MTGDDQRNPLQGEGGADSLNGHEGDDKLFGGDGNEDRAPTSWRGGAGTDLAYYGLSDAAVTVDLVWRLAWAAGPRVGSEAGGGDCMASHPPPGSGSRHPGQLLGYKLNSGEHL